MRYPRYIIVLLILLKVLVFSSFATGQASSKYDAGCVEAIRVSYADSLEHLLLANRPIKIIQIADSLLVQYGDIVCSDVLRIQMSRANAYELMYNFEEAIQIYIGLLKTSKNHQLSLEQISISLSLARAYEFIGRPAIAKEYLDSAKRLIDTHGKDEFLSRYFVRLASYTRIYEDVADAKTYAKEAVALGIKDGVVRSVADGNLVLGLVTEEFEESIGYSKKAADLFLELGDYVGSMAQEMNIAQKYLQRGKHAKVLETIHFVNRYITEISDNQKAFYQIKLRSAQLKAQVYESSGEREKLIAELKSINQYSQLSGDLVNQEKINQLVIDNTVRQEQEKAQWAEKLSLFFFVSLLLLSVITAVLLRYYLLNRSKKKKIDEQTITITRQYKELEKLYNYQTTLLSEVHHRIKNNLQLIISLLTLQKSKIGDDFDGQILDVLSYRIQSISLIHEQLYNLKEFEKVNVDLYINDLLKNFKSLISQKSVSIEHKVDFIEFNLETITPLGLIWSELISNSLKYNQDANHLKIYFYLVKKGDLYSMHYFDNGIGYPEGQFKANRSGMGFTIIQSLTRQLSAKTKAYNSNGAHFTMEFKEKTISPL